MVPKKGNVENEIINIEAIFELFTYFFTVSYNFRHPLIVKILKYLTWVLCMFYGTAFMLEYYFKISYATNCLFPVQIQADTNNTNRIQERTKNILLNIKQLK